MLTALFGNKNIEKILTFLFVNGRCYGSQLQRLLDSPLTPLQHALARLEKGGIIFSSVEGKTRIYQFNPSFPLLEELEQLLKKSYTLLPGEDKRRYSRLIEERYQGSRKNTDGILRDFWKKLAIVRHVSFQAAAKPQSESGWEGKGSGTVEIVREGERCLIFHEKGSWKNRAGGTIDFKNSFRWTYDPLVGVISLEHLRRGINHPVFLFDLTPANTESLRSIDSHLCAGDVYFGRLDALSHALRLYWRVIGPRKNEEIHVHYF